MLRRLIYSISFVVLLSVASSVQALTEITTANGNGADTYLSNDGQTGDFGPDSVHGGDDAFSVRTCAGIRQKIGYVRFDISNVTGDLTGATLSVYLTLSTRSRTWGIYGLVDETGDNWDEAAISYNNAPGVIPNPPTALGYYAIDETKLERIGDFDVTAGGGTYITSSTATLNMDNFINADTNKLLTFAFIYETDSTDTNPDWWMTAKEDDPVMAPRLTFPNALTPPATYPSPGNGEIVYDTTVSLQWQVGSYAAQHDIYLSDSFSEVDRATSGSPMGAENVYKARQDANNYTVTDLVPGTTYYWRIDEVNNLHPDVLWRGEIWSFAVQSLTAYDPIPPDDFVHVAPKMTLHWAAGSGAVTGHRVYLGDDFDAVSNASADSDALPYRAFLTPSADPNWNPAKAGVSLVFNKTYYWRIDEVDGANRYKGDVWSFMTVYAPPTTEPNLVGWWKFDGDASDSSGYRCDGTAYGNPEPNYVEGVFDDAIYLLGTTGAAPNQYVDLPIGSVISTLTNSTFAVWVSRIPTVGQKWHRIFDFGTGTTAYMALLPFRSSSPPTNFEITSDEVLERVSWGPYSNEGTVIPADEWHHFAVTFNADTKTLTLYVDGVVPDDGGRLTDTTLTPSVLGFTINNWVGRAQGWIGTTTPALFRGYVDDLRIYDRALSQTEIQDILTPPRAWMPSPANGTTNVKMMPTLTWRAGSAAADENGHRLYLSSDFNDVNDREPAAFISSLTEARYRVTTPLELNSTYYWAVDEVDGLDIWLGRIWSFTTADYITVDNFEDYNDTPPYTVWNAWADGYGDPTNGSQVGHDAPGPYAEQTIVNSGSQSMPMDYNNIIAGLSEATMTLTSGRDWTREGVRALSLWFRGYPAYVGGFTEGPAGTYTMTATGADIWGQADEFHFAYKMLAGVGAVEAQVLSVENVDPNSDTDPWAKGGVMIRNTLEPGSKFAAVYITPGNGCRFQARLDTDVNAVSDTEVATDEQIAITAPYWIRLERDISGDFRGYYSSNGSNWQLMSWSPVNIQMNTTLYVGLPVTSHNVDATCQAQFSNVTIEGNVSGDWVSQDIGILSNDAERLYVAVANSTGEPAVVYHDDPNAAQINTWTEWNIDMKDFEDQGVDLTDVNSIIVGLGNRDNPQPGGLGIMYFDDIRLYRPRCVPDKVPLEGDVNDDCAVDFGDLQIVAGDWLASGEDLAADVNADSTVDLEDYAILADEWLEQLLWPE